MEAAGGLAGQGRLGCDLCRRSWEPRGAFSAPHSTLWVGGMLARKAAGIWDAPLGYGSFYFCSSPPSPGHVCLSLGLKTGGKRKQAHSNTKTSLAAAGRRLAGEGRGAAGAGGRGWPCRERAPGGVRGTSWKPQKKYEHKTGRVAHAGRPRHPSPSTGSPRGPTCGFSPSPPCPCSPRRCRCCAGCCARQIWLSSPLMECSSSARNFVRPAVELVLLLAPGWGLRLLLPPAPT